MKRIVPLLLALVLLATVAPAWPQSRPDQPTTAAATDDPPQLTLFQAVVLGIVEGVTEYLPVSSTGHLILASHFLGADTPEMDRAVDAFNIVIQIGAILAVVGLYRRRVWQMLRGLAGRDRAGLVLFGKLFVAFLPAAVIGVLIHDWIEARLMAPGPVVGALAVGGVLMIAVDRMRRKSSGSAGAGIDAVTWRMALIIGFAQCLAMWPGTSRSMITIVAAVLVGMEIKSAAEFSFLLALPTLGGASVYAGAKRAGDLLDVAGPAGLIVGLAVAWLVAAVSVKWLVGFLNRRGLEPFGYYRLVLAAVLLALVWMGYM